MITQFTRQTDQQVHIARIASVQLHYDGNFHTETLQAAKEMKISEGRLLAMANFIRTKGQPTQFRNFP